MKYVVFSDIHGNIVALKEMLKQTKADNIEGYIFAGDIIGYFFHQEEVIDCLKNINKLYAVRGNHDNGYLHLLKDSEHQEHLAFRYGLSYKHTLKPVYYKYLLELPCCIKMNICGKKVAILHGSLENCLEGRVYKDTNNIDYEKYQKYDIVFCGHTHYRMARREGKTLIINPGSLGQPRDGKGFSYCIYDFSEGTVVFCEVELNKKALLDEMQNRGEQAELISYIQRTFGRSGNGG